MKKGFTLIELLGVLVVISIIALIVFPSIGTIITSSRQSMHDEQVSNIESATAEWATDNDDLLDIYHLNIIYIDLKSIQNGGYLTVGKLTDPMNKKEMNGCTQVKYDLTTKKYNYAYVEETCDNYATSTNDETLGYIIYNYENNNYVKTSKSKELEPAGLQIYNYYKDNKIIYADGDTKDGLYELDEEYVFRGANPYNYVTLQGTDKDGKAQNTSWKILSISKNDYSLKLINTSGESNQWDSKGKSDFAISSSNVLLTDKSDYGTNKLIDSDFLSGTISGDSYSVRAITSSLSKKLSLKVGLMSVIDYVNASATSTCPSNYMDSTCKDNNYLFTLFNSNSAWTINDNGSQIWSIGTDGTLQVASSSEIKKLYSVIKLSSNVYINDFSTENGSSTIPYKIK